MAIPRWIRSTARALALVVVAISGLYVALQTNPGRSLAVTLIESAASSDGRAVKIEGLEGRLPDDLRIASISVSDAKGVWLEVERTHLAWSPFALVMGQIVIEDFDVGRIDWRRNPEQPPTPAPKSADGAGSLPALAVRRIAIATLAVDGAVAGTPGTFAIDGALDTLEPATRATLKLAVKEQRGARADISAEYSDGDGRLDLDAGVRDAAGGTLAAMLGLPADAPLAIDLKSSGPLDAWQARLKATGGGALNASGQATVRRSGSRRALAVTLDADIGEIGPQAFRPLLNGHTTIAVDAARSDDGGVRLDRFDVASPALSASASGSTDAARKRTTGKATLTIPESRPLAPLLGDDLAWRDLVVNASVESGEPAPVLIVDAKAAEFAGAPATLKLRGKLAKLDALTDTVADLEAYGLALRFSGDASTKALRGIVAADASNLTQLGFEAGTLSLQATVDADLTAATFKADGKGTARNLALDGAIDGLLTGTSELSYALSGSANEIRIAQLSLDNSHLSLRAKGTVAAEKLDASGTVTVADIGAIAPEHAGRAEIDVHASGSPKTPRIAATARLQSGTIFGRKVRALKLALSESDRAGHSRLLVSGDYDGRPVHGRADVTWHASGGAGIADLELTIASLALSGSASLDARWLTQGELALNVGDLADLGPFVGEDISGPLAGTVRLHHAGQKQSTAIALTAPRFRIDTTSLAGLKLSGTIADLFGNATLDLKAAAAAFEDGAFALQGIEATGRGPLDALTIRATATKEKAMLAANGILKVAGKPTRIAIDTLEVTRADKHMRLVQPIEMTVGNHRALLPQAQFAAGRGKATVSGDAGRNTDLKVTADGLPLWVADFVSDSPIPVMGTVSGTVRIATQGATSFDVAVAALNPASQPGLLRNMTLKAAGKSDKAGADVDLTLTDRGRTSFRASGRIPFNTGAPLALSADGSADLALANAYLNVAGDRVRGVLTASAKIKGTLSAPRVDGSAKISNGLFSSAASGFELRNVEAVLQGNERQIAIASLTASTPNGGKVTGQGNIRLEPLNGYPLTLTVKASNAQLVSTELSTVVADIDARMTGSLMKEARISGTADLDRWEIRIPQKLARPLNPIDVTHRNAPPGFSPATPAEVERESGLTIGLDVMVRAPRRVFVRGQGIDAEFAGRVKITGTVADPIANGAFELRRGDVSILSQRIALTRGDIRFAGPIVPALDIAGEVRKADLTATIAVKGKATEPTITLSSTPAMPQDEIMARLLFGKSVQQLSALEAAQLAAAVARWSGLSTGPNIIERLRSALGIDALSAVTDEKGGAAVGAGTYVGKGVYVGVVQGADTTSGRATVEIDITDNVKLRGEASPSGNTKVGVAAEWEY